MKNITFIILLSILFLSCEKEVQLDLNTAPPRLVVDASINWIKGTNGSEQKIKLTTTTDYYNTEIPVASGAIVYITNSNDTIFEFVEALQTGEYICNYFIPQINEEYTLTILYNGETYTAKESLYAVPDIARIEQNNNGGFFGDDIEVRFFYQDNPAEDNFYLTKFSTSIIPYPEYSVSNDELSQGNEMFDFFYDEDLKPGHKIDIQLSGTSKRFYNYMSLLLQIAGGGGGPFQSPPATIKGNVINQNNENNYALGYFRLSETDVREYIIK